MKKQDKALRLADTLGRLANLEANELADFMNDAAAELRRLQVERDELLDALKKIAGLTMSQFMSPQDLARECITIANNATSKATGQ